MFPPSKKSGNNGCANSTIFVLGGTGTLGYHVCNTLAAENHRVITYALESPPANCSLHPNVTCRVGDLFKLSDCSLIELFKQCDAFVYTAGKDERVVPDTPAERFFRRENVEPTARIARLCGQSGSVKCFILLSSIYAHLALKPQSFRYKLAEQPYPKTRLEQEQAAIEESNRATGGRMRVISLRLPFVFGHTPGRVPMYVSFLEEVVDKDTIECARGSIAAVTIAQVATAVCGALRNGEHEARYLLNGQTLSVADMYRVMAEAVGNGYANVVEVDANTLAARAQEKDAHERALGRQHGVGHAVLAYVMSEHATEPRMANSQVLGYTEDDVEDACRACMEEALAFKEQEAQRRRAKLPPSPQSGPIDRSLPALRMQPATIQKVDQAQNMAM